MRRIIVLLMVSVIVAVMVLLAAGGPAMASRPSEHFAPKAACNEGTENAHEEAVPEEGAKEPGSAAQHTETAHGFGIPCEP